MKFSEQWLREWVNPPVNTHGLAEQLTMAGIEIDSITPLSNDPTKFSLDAHVTPNRGDCLSIAGIAREVAVLNNIVVKEPKISEQPITISDQFSITVKEPEHCPRYLGRVIRNINPHAITPIWMQEKLQASDINCIHPVVDITNYVLLEMGQPMHAFDLAKLHGSIIVRLAKNNEKITLLDEKEIILDKEALVIADEKQAQALAGIMGGLDSAVTETTKDIFLECAYFNPLKMAGRARSYGLNTDSSYRFERGIDPDIQYRAMERATQLILEIASGQAGPIVKIAEDKYLVKPRMLILHHDRLERLLGISIAAEKIESILKKLGMSVVKKAGTWQVTTPVYRYDINIEEDLIEEVARIYGYNNIPNKYPQTELKFFAEEESQLTLTRLRNLMIDREYQEAITYSFIAPEAQKLIVPDEKLLPLLNPISAELSVMRASLWPGLLNAVVYNQNRQQTRIRLFETGLRYFLPKEGLENIVQQNMLAGVATGNIYSEQWGNKNRSLDFFDIKNDVEAIIHLTGHAADFYFQKGNHPALHPGQNAQILLRNEVIGQVGALHPALLKKFDLISPVFLFELKLDAITAATLPVFDGLSKFPAIRRDISFWIDSNIAVQNIFDVVHESAGKLLVNLCLFDVYQSKDKNAGQRSLALGLLLQHPDRTLIDDEVNSVMEKVMDALRKKFSVNLRAE